MRQFFPLIIFFLLAVTSFAQEKQYKVAAIGFYNLENLFDTIDEPDVRDSEFTPKGSRSWGTKLYVEKLENMAKVVADIGTDLTPDGVSILGVSEIENRKVLEDLVKEEAIADRNYQIVHHNSSDERGIDVAFLYQPKYFEVLGKKAFPVLLFRSDSSRDFTRDVLLVSGKLDGELIHLMVNHWPSRSGGEKASEHKRAAAARVCKMVTDSLIQENPDAKIILLGDLNDDPTSPSVKEVLAAKTKKSKTKSGDLYNATYDLFKKGNGTLAYRDSWNLFDQIIISEELLDEKTEGYRHYQTRIFNKKYLYQKSGRYKGYPFRTFGGDTYQGGYSDHFPVYVYLIKEI